MNILLIILTSIAAFVVFMLIVALFMRKEYSVKRDIVINAPLDKVFGYVRQLKNQDHFNKWVMVEPDMKKEFTGTDGSVGFIYGWNGKKAGEGEQEIMSVEEGKNIRTEIRFVRPFVAIANVNMTTEALSENQTKVTWSNVSAMKYPMNLMVPMVEKMLPKDMDISLNYLKNILEK